MKVGSLLAGVLLLSCVSADAQLSGEFYLQKTSFARWEPVFLYYRVTNNGRDEVTIPGTLDPSQPGCSGHSITVSSDPISTPSCPNLKDNGCIYNGPGARSVVLQPGDSYTERFLLNYNHDIHAPGDYWVEAKHSGSRNQPVQVLDTKLNFRVEESPIAPSELQPWVDALNSTDPGKRFEAARTLASTAPPNLEDLLTGFATSLEFKRHAPLALHRLNTPRSIDAMAMLMQGPVSNEQMDAAHYLAVSNDQRWYPLIAGRR